MPSTYAHYRLGQEVRARLSGDSLKAIEKYPELYNAGLHGPDILFYYNAMIPNRVAKLGNVLHTRSGRGFFEKAADVIRKMPNGEPYIAYALGVICHFALDVMCHGYVGEYEAETGITHAEIEVELDREMLVHDGYDPVRKRLTDHIVPSSANAAVIAPFYDGISPTEARKAMKDFVFYNDLLLAPSPIKRGIVYAGLFMAGAYKSKQGMVVNYKPNPGCSRSTADLMAKYAEAVPLAVRLAEGFIKYLAGEELLEDTFKYNFESALPEGE